MNDLNDTVSAIRWTDAGLRLLDQRCLPDIDHAQWTELVLQAEDEASLAARLRALGVTHLLLSLDDLDFILQHDPDGAHRGAFEYFQRRFQPACAQEIYSDDWTRLYALSCP